MRLVPLVTCTVEKRNASILHTDGLAAVSGHCADVRSVDVIGKGRLYSLIVRYRYAVMAKSSRLFFTLYIINFCELLLWDYKIFFTSFFFRYLLGYFLLFFRLAFTFFGMILRTFHLRFVLIGLVFIALAWMTYDICGYAGCPKCERALPQASAHSDPEMSSMGILLKAHTKTDPLDPLAFFMF